MSNTFKPILFSTPMVQAILNGTKTQTRRIIKPQPKEGYLPKIHTDHFGKRYLESRKSAIELEYIDWKFYQIGDILWVRETFGKLVTDDSFCYAADVCCPKYDKPFFGWKPSIHMPKEAARIFLKVTNVRCERLNDITEADAIAEGIEKTSIAPFVHRYKNYLVKQKLTSPISSFKTLWMKINGLESWEENPYVWVYDFEVIEKPLDFLSHE